ncbi:MAG: hypothetical protein ABW252_16645 [Polyangiales bacterium]
MPNESGRAYALTALCPLIRDSRDDQSYAAIVKGRLRALPVDEDSPMAKVPNTYLCRLFVLDDVVFQGHPASEEHLRSKYLVFVAEVHGRLRPYLEGMWRQAEPLVRSLWQFCVGFSEVDGSEAWVRYVERCQVPTTFYFNGSNDEPLAEQLKGLYLKQELARFAREHQGLDPLSLQRAFAHFVERVQPSNLAAPTWRPGASSLRVAVRSGAPEGH